MLILILILMLIGAVVLISVNASSAPQNSKRSIEKARLDKEKYYNDPFIKKCYEDGVFKDIFVTDTYTFCNVANWVYIWSPYMKDDSDYIGVMFNWRILKDIRNNPDAVTKFLTGRTWYFKEHATLINEKWVEIVTDGFEERKKNPSPNINLKFEEEIINWQKKTHKDKT